MLYLYYYDGNYLVLCCNQVVEGVVTETCVRTKRANKIEDHIYSIEDINELQLALSYLFLGMS